MFERLEQTESRYRELEASLAMPEVISDSAKYQKAAKAHAELAPLIQKYREYKDLKRGIDESKALIAEESDAEMQAYAKEELAGLAQLNMKSLKAYDYFTYAKADGKDVTFGDPADF